MAYERFVKDDGRGRRISPNATRGPSASLSTQ